MGPFVLCFCGYKEDIKRTLDVGPFNQLLRGNEPSQKCNSTRTPKVQGKGRKTVSLDFILPVEPFVNFLRKAASVPSGPHARMNAQWKWKLVFVSDLRASSSLSVAGR